MASGKPSPKVSTPHVPDFCEFGESDDPDWVSLYPDERHFCSLSPVCTPRSVEPSPEIEPVSTTCMELELPPPSRVLRRRHGNSGKQEERKKRLGKRKSCIVSEDNEEMKKQESLRQRKKVYVGELEKKLGNMTSAIEELNSTINLIGNDTSTARNQLPYLYQATGETSFNAPAEPSTNLVTKPVRSRKRVSKKGGGWLRTARKFRRHAQNALLVFLCFIMLFFPLKLGLHGVGLWLKGGSGAQETENWSGYVTERYGPVNLERETETPRYVRDTEGSSRPGLGTSLAMAGRASSGCKAGKRTTYSPIQNLTLEHHNQTTSPGAEPLEVKRKQTEVEESRLEHQPQNSGTVFTPGKCTQVFQYTVPREGLRSGSSNGLRGKSQSEKIQRPVAVGRGGPVKRKLVPPMVVSVLPNRSSATGENVFVVVVVDGATYVTYSCSLPQHIIPTGP